MKCKCGNDKFYIQKRSNCDDCDKNPAWDGKNFIYDLKKIEENNLERDGVHTNGECKLGPAYGVGCHLYICTNCKDQKHWAAIEADY